MELSALGFDQWFAERTPESLQAGYDVARVTAVHRDSYLVRNGNLEVFAELAGNFVYAVESDSEYPAVGDWALIKLHNASTFAIIHGIFPRKSFLRRKHPGRKIAYQMIAANIDVALIVQSCDFDFNLRRLERYLVMINEGHIAPLLILTKCDLVSSEKLAQILSEVRQANITCKVVPLSNVTGFGVDNMRQLLEPGKSYCLVGSSGVGKTTLLNHIIGRDLFATNEVRASDGKGKHTTSQRQLIVLDQGAMLIDTPGMRELGNIGVSSGLEESFSDIGSLAKSCRFTNCTHTQEVGCALLAAIEKGTLHPERYQSYLKLMKESEYYEMSYLEKRRKDRKFGQFIKSELKHHKR